MRLIAFYLPQYHETPENNAFWGKGFTEWTSVKNSKSLFEKHFQPRLPTELGFYDLNDDSVRYKQAALARQYGIDAWCYYYYRFNGKRVLEMPLNRHFEDKNLNMPFLICWANENWTRTWDGNNQDILIKQEHNFEDDLNFIKEVAPMLIDERYVKIDGKPVLLIYRPKLWKEIEQTVNIWRTYMKTNFNLDIFLIQSMTFEQVRTPINPKNINFDASYQFPPFGTSSYHVNDVKRSLVGNLSIYKNCIEMVNQNYGFKLFRGVMTGFDNSPRRKGQNFGIFLNAKPVFYKQWLEKAVEYTKINFKQDEQLIFINAWNEWGEGAILEPCNQWGRGFLEATLEARKIIDSV
jgi:lipopolysaccharide biosynthesis protein